jgi:hypothetical protein
MQVAMGEVVVSDEGHTLELMKGPDGSLATARSLSAVLATLQDGFDPVISSVRACACMRA